MLVKFVDIPWTGENGKLRSDSIHAVGADGSTPTYTGYYVNLPRDALNRNMSIGPGESVRRTIDVSANYDLKAEMVYDIRLTPYRQSNATSADAEHNRATFVYTTTPTIKVVSPRKSITPFHQSGDTSAAIRTTSLCTVPEFIAVFDALAASGKLATNTYEYLSSLYTEEFVDGKVKAVFKQTPRYTSWFGMHGDPNDPDPVDVRFRQVVEATSSRYSSVSIPSCECSDEDEALGVNAWITPTSPYLINYCPAFFNLPLGPNIRTGSQAATIYHEMTHFSDSFATGASDLDATFATPGEARHLATSARDLAADHAYSFEYFADNFSNEE